MYNIKYSRDSVKQIPKLQASGLKEKTLKLISIVKENPYQNPPPYEKLSGNLCGIYSRRINVKHRLIYKVYNKNEIVYILSMWTHYESIY